MKDDLNLERRMIVAFALSALVLLVTLPFLPKKKQPAPAPARPAQTRPAQSAPSGATPPPPAVPSTPAPAQGSIQASAQQTITVDTQVFHIVFNNRGGVVQSWVLKKYHDEYRHPLDLVDPTFTKENGSPLTLRTGDSGLDQQLNQALFQPSTTRLDGPGKLVLRWSNGTLSVVKTLTFDQSYIVHVETAVMRNGSPVEAAVTWPGVFGDHTVKNHYTTESAFRASGSLDTFQAKKIDNGGTWTGEYRFAGLEDQYFALVFLPSGTQPFRVLTLKTKFQPTEKLPNGKPLEAKPVETLGMGLSTGAVNSFRLFVGPKQIDLLKSIDPQLRNLVDFGWFSFLADPLFLWMKWTYTHWIHNWGWVILFVTFVITMAIFPLRIRGMKSQIKMSALQPKINAINAKMKKLPMKDPRRQELQQEMMKVYSDHGVNPLGGCLPMLLPMPLIFAFYKVLEYAIELRHAPWIGYLHDLSAADPYFILPIVLIVTQFWTMQLMPMAPGQDPKQAKLMRWMMPAFLGYIFLFLPSGVNLYYLASNLMGAAQQVYINKKYTPQAALAAAPAGKGGGKPRK